MNRTQVMKLQMQRTILDMDVIRESSMALQYAALAKRSVWADEEIIELADKLKQDAYDARRLTCELWRQAEKNQWLS